MTSCASVVPLTRLGKGGSAYTYSIPQFLAGSLHPGHLVHVPFRSRTLPGIVMDLSAPYESDGLKELADLADEQPVLLPHHLRLAEWMAQEYAAPLADVLRAMVPAALKSLGQSRRKPAGAVASMVSITAAGRGAIEDATRMRRAPLQHRVLVALANAGGPLVESELLATTGASRASLISLTKHRLLVRQEMQILREAPAGTSYRPFALSQAQKKAAAGVLEALAPEGNGSPRIFLLHGVTGSGKTEVYMAAIEAVLKRSGHAIVMVPEISLTPQAVRRFASRFPGQVAALHSKLSEGERRAEWQRIRDGHADIVIGPRSALFAPLKNIRLIIVDEEHDSSYKQAESPRYHARDVAMQLGRMLDVPVILGSATPDVVSYFAARRGRYRLLTLPDRPVWATDSGANSRVGHSPAPATSPERKVVSGDESAPDITSRAMPPVEIVDLRQELKAGHRSIFSRSLLAAMEDTLAAGHQALLFLNRRGSATAVVCRDCGYVARCERCDIPLTYHSSHAFLICHRCDRRRRSPRQCDQCGGSRIRYLGIGTQRVAEEAKRVLPDARVVRWDRDVTGKKGSHEKIADMFGRHEADVLVGTQMIAKGLDFPLVTLVGVILADVGLHLPDFRAGERTFQLVTQVAGRAGRAELPSRVIVQAYTPDHYALQAARNHDYLDFYRQEMTFRLESGYPPFSRLARLLFRGKDSRRVERYATELREIMMMEIKVTGIEDIEVMGPAPAFMARIDDIFQWHLVIRGSPLHRLLHLVPDDVAIDVDPVDML